jgi:hypothetical protein
MQPAPAIPLRLPGNRLPAAAAPFNAMAPE